MLKEARQLFKNFLSLATGVFITRLFSTIANLYVARALGPADFGIFSFGLEVALIFSVCVNLGLDDLLVREVARRTQGVASLIGDAIVLKSMVLPLGALVTLLLSLYNPNRSWLFLVLVAYSLVYSYFLVFCAVFRGLEQMEFQMLLMSSQMFLVATGSILSVRFTRNVTVVTLCYLLAAAITMGGGYVLLSKKGIRPQYRWQPATWKPLLVTSLPFGLAFISMLVYERLSTISIATLSGETASGWFNSMHNIILVLSTIPSIIAAATFPLLSRRARQSPRNIAAIAANLIKYTTVVSLGLAIVLYISAPWAVPLLYGAAYEPSILLLQIMAAAVPFFFLNLTLVGVLEAANQQAACAKGIGYTLLVAIPICLGATWLGGYQGGTVAYAVNHVLLTGVLFRLVSRTVGRFKLGQIFVLPATASAVAGVAAYVGRQWSLIALIPVVCCCYAAVLILHGWLNPQEAATLRALWRSRRGHDPSLTSPEPEVIVHYPPE